MPAKHIGAACKIIPDKVATALLQRPHPESSFFAWRETADGAEYPNHKGNAAVWTRPDMARAVHAAAMSANGIRCLAEVDDNFISDHDQNIFMRTNDYYDDRHREQHLRALGSFDGIIFSTEKLRDIYWRAFRRELRHDPEMFVARNHIDAETWEDRENLLPPSERVRVGWAGGHQHVWDLRLAAPALRLAYDMGCEVVLIGLNPAAHDPEWEAFLPDYTYLPWMSAAEYHTKRLNVDIGLCPLVQNQHTDGKSDSKFLEYSMSGAATVATSSPVYNKTIIHGETGLLAASPDGMALMVQHLIVKSGARRKMAAAAKQWVLENRTIQANKSEWTDAING